MTGPDNFNQHLQTMNKDMTMTDNGTGLDENYDAESAPFSPAIMPAKAERLEVVAVDGVPARRADSMLAQGVSQACAMADAMGRQADAARRAARAHLVLTLSLGCLLENIRQYCKRAGVNYTSLFSDAKPGKVRDDARAAAGGCGFNFTYRTSRNYVNAFLHVHAKMLEDGMSEATLGRMMTAHAARLAEGALEAADAETLWGPYVSAGNLRQAYLELAPEKPAPTLGERLDEAEATPATMATWEDQRSRLCSEFGGWFATLDDYIATMSRYTNKADRIAQAEQLEDAARRLRAMETQPELPGVTANREEA